MVHVGLYHVCVTFGYPSCLGFEIVMWKNEQINATEHPRDCPRRGSLDLTRGRTDH